MTKDAVYIKCRCPRCRSIIESVSNQDVRCPFCRLTFDKMEVVDE